MVERVKISGLRVSVLTALCATALLAATPTVAPDAPDAPVAEAAERGDLNTLRTLLREGADVNAAQGDGMTALHWAALHGDAEMVRVLMYAGSHIESTTRLGGYTPLHLASKDGHVDAVAALLVAGGNANALTTTGVTPLHFAAAAGNPGALAALLEHGAELDAPEMAHGQTPLMFAAAGGRLEAVETLLAADADFAIATTVIDFAERSESDGEARGRRQELTAAIRKAEAQASGEWVEDDEEGFTTRTDTPSGQAPTRREARDRAQRDSAEAATLGAGATATQRPAPPPEALSYAQLVGRQGGMTALHYAVREGHVDIVKRLLAAGTDIDRKTEGDESTSLVIAIVNGHYDMATNLLGLGADPNIASEDGVAPLYATIANRWAPKSLYPQPTAYRQQELSYREMMKNLLVAGADPNVRVSTHIWYASFNFDLLGVNFMGGTPFWRAAKALDIPAMELLVAYGADPQIPSRKPAQRRRRRSASSAEETLDPSGLPPVEVGGPGVPPLVVAAGFGYGRSRTGNSHRHAPDSWLDAAKYLVEQVGADVNGRDHDGFGAIHYAAARGDNELIEYLVGRGADPTIIARTGQTTVDMANGPIQRVQPFFETIALLEGMGAKNNNKCLSC